MRLGWVHYPRFLSLSLSFDFLSLSCCPSRNDGRDATEHDCKIVMFRVRVAFNSPFNFQWHFENIFLDESHNHCDSLAATLHAVVRRFCSFKMGIWRLVSIEPNALHCVGSWFRSMIGTIAIDIVDPIDAAEWTAIYRNDLVKFTNCGKCYFGICIVWQGFEGIEKAAVALDNAP